MAQNSTKRTKKSAAKVKAKCTSGQAGSGGGGPCKAEAVKPKATKSKKAGSKTNTPGKIASKKKSAPPAKAKARTTKKSTGSLKSTAPADSRVPVEAAKKRPPIKITAEEPLDNHGAVAEQKPPRPLRKSRLTPEELNMFREMLIAKRDELLSTVSQLRDDALHKSRQESAGDLSAMPIHMADIGSDNWEQEFTLGLLANENELLREIDEALQRMDSGTYGVCVATNKHIQKRRLRAKPWAKYCIEYARQLELRRGR